MLRITILACLFVGSVLVGVASSNANAAETAGDKRIVLTFDDLPYVSGGRP
jgi:peptidoglycan/xylan/chitin deacetylase (PgdA/CDA1 family)